MLPSDNLSCACLLLGDISLPCFAHLCRTYLVLPGRITSLCHCTITGTNPSSDPPRHPRALQYRYQPKIKQFTPWLQLSKIQFLFPSALHTGIFCPFEETTFSVSRLSVTAVLTPSSPTPFNLFLHKRRTFPKTGIKPTVSPTSRQITIHKETSESFKLITKAKQYKAEP